MSCKPYSALVTSHRRKKGVEGCGGMTCQEHSGSFCAKELVKRTSHTIRGYDDDPYMNDGGAVIDITLIDILSLMVGPGGVPNGDKAVIG